MFKAKTVHAVYKAGEVWTKSYFGDSIVKINGQTVTARNIGKKTILADKKIMKPLLHF